MASTGSCLSNTISMFHYAAGGGRSSSASAHGKPGTHHGRRLPESRAGLLWRHEIGGAVASAPTVADGVVYFGSEDHHVYALDAATGRVLWRFLAEREVWHSPTVHDGTVYVTSTRGYYGDGNSPVYALEAATGGNALALPRERLRGVIPGGG